ncbi:TonB-dependent receptor [Marinomonas sp. 2405UD66-6]|uniref:TonB-dependent receptor n=1 Tax=Marinomonas sp. 2405UD66-6 TaxID=3391834 RepID=UPI0039C8D36A
MHLSKKIVSTNTPSRLSSIALAVISINAAFISVNALAEDTTSLSTLIVTGEKVDKDIKDTTTAVTVIGEESYASGEAKEVNDIVVQAPNVTAAGFGTINIRGVNGAGAAVGSNAFMTGGSPRITTSVDGVSEAWGGYNFTPAGLWDTQTVEVLRGPQSTSQGTNAIGGAVVIKTNDPSFEPESAIRLGLEQYENDNLMYNLGAMNTGTLIDDELAYRLSFDGTKGEGWINYDIADSDAADSPDLDDSESTNLRGKLLWEPANIEGLTAKLSITHRENEGEYLSWINGDSSNYSSRTSSIDSSSYENTRLQDSTVDTISVDVDYDISNHIKNQLQVSYNSQDASFDEYPGSTLLRKTEDTITAENRVILTPNDSKFASLIGVYASQADTTLDVDFGSSDSNYFISDGTKTTFAVFGETTYDITNQLSVTAGGRIEHQDQDRVLVKASTYTLDQDESETILLPKLSAIYELTESTTVGASIRRGYNAGGAALNWSTNEYYTYDKEEVTAIELSSKTRFNRMSVNANIFYNNYSDYQAYTSYTLENVDTVHTYGAELEITSLVTNDLEVRGSIGTLQNKISTNSDSTSDWDGNELTYAPDLNLGLGFTQYIGDNISFGADATYVSEYYADLDNTEDYKSGDYIVTNARAQYSTGNLTIDGYITNLTNEDIVYLINRGTRASVGQSRTIGVSATYRM